MPKKPATQDEARERAFAKGALPESDRRAAEVAAQEQAAARASEPPAPLSQAAATHAALDGPRQDTVLGTMLEPRSPGEIAAGVPADTRTAEQIAAGVPAPVDEVERLLGLAEHETGYAQKQAVADLRRLLGRPVIQTRLTHPIDARPRHGPFQGRTAAEIAAGVPARDVPPVV